VKLECSNKKCKNHHKKCCLSPHSYLMDGEIYILNCYYNNDVIITHKRCLDRKLIEEIEEIESSTESHNINDAISSLEV